MELRPFGVTRRPVAVVGQGTWYLDRADAATAISALRLGIDLGMTHIDTAEYYGDAERLTGAAIEGRREKVFLVEGDGLLQLGDGPLFIPLIAEVGRLVVKLVRGRHRVGLRASVSVGMSAVL